MSDLQVTVAQVEVRNLSTGKTVYDVKCGDGEVRQVWEAPLANAINTFSGTGQAISIRENVKINGQYTNRTITAFAPPGQALAADTGQGGGRPGFQKGGGMTPDDKTRIAKMAAQGTAYEFIGALLSGSGPEAIPEAVEQAEALVKTLYKAARSHEKPETQVLQTGAQGQVLPQAANVLPVAGAAVAATPGEVAATVPGVQVGTGQAQDAAAEAPQAAPADDIDWS